jgi:hypothetical protein
MTRRDTASAPEANRLESDHAQHSALELSYPFQIRPRKLSGNSIGALYEGVQQARSRVAPWLIKTLFCLCQCAELRLHLLEQIRNAALPSLIHHVHEGRHLCLPEAGSTHLRSVREYEDYRAGP